MESITTDHSQPPTTFNSSAIAIIGMAGRFPGANNLQTFWDNIKNGKETISFFTDEQLREKGISSKVLSNPKYVKAKGIIDDIDLFDAIFFDYSPYEATITDPHHRLFLELAWEALENAGYCSEKFQGRIGVFAGMASYTNSYLHEYVLKNPKYAKDLDYFNSIIAVHNAFLSTKVSYKLNLTGPSLNINTACSTSLVAVVTACKQLLNYDCDIALAGGITIALPQENGYLYQEGGIQSADGHCRAFSEDSNGTISSNGAGIVVLKRLEDAIEDGDRIDGVVIGNAINNDGSDKVSFTAPSVIGQASCIYEAITMAGIHPESIGYVEAHGTATALGDPIEISALTKAFQTQTSKKQFCAIGSVKTNIGHTDCASGVASLIKTIFALKNKQIPPSLHFKKPNPNIDFANSPFYVNTSLQPFYTNANSPCRAGVSSFGIGGTNAHVIIEEAPILPPSANPKQVQIFPLSAKTANALENITNNLYTFLQDQGAKNLLTENRLADIAYTLQVGRKDFAYRKIIVSKSKDEILLGLKDPSNSAVDSTAFKSSGAVFMFPGQGAQYPNMGIDLYHHEPIFKDAVDKCCNILLAYSGTDFREVLYPNNSGDPEKLNNTVFTQPAIFIIEYALAQLFISWGIKPKAVIGHSLGEYVAAVIAKVFSLEDALILVANRAKLFSQIAEGAMLSLYLSEVEITPLLENDLSLAAINAENLSVISGPKISIDNFLTKLKSIFPEKTTNARFLKVSHAFHSQMVEPILNKYSNLMKGVTINPPGLPFISTCTGKLLIANEMNHDYWIKQMRKQITFQAGITEAFALGFNTFLELGPGNSLSSLTALNNLQNSQPGNLLTLSVLPAAKNLPEDSKSSLGVTYNALAKLWLHGITSNWHAFHGNTKRHRVPLPTYPFEKQRYWADPDHDPQAAILQNFTESASKPFSQEKQKIFQPKNINVIELALKKIFSYTLGIDENKFSTEDSFYDLGGNSLLALRLIEKIEKAFATKIPFPTFSSGEANNVSSLAKLLTNT